MLKELDIGIHIDQMLPKRLYGDVGKIKQVLLNLLLNALKYTDEGSVDLRVSMESRTNEECTICVHVKDTGNGIRQEILETVFDAYGAFEREAKDLHLKTGLGLDISRRFAELMGGELVCTSEVGKGSEFVFTLKQKIVDPTPLGNFSESDEAVQHGAYTPEFIAPDADVLVASENLITLDILDSLLKATKVFVTRANSRQEFVDKARKSSFNIAFIDEMLFDNDENKMDDFIAKMKEINSAIPVYIITEGAIFDEASYKQKGFCGILSLPVDPLLLEKTIMLYLPKEMMEQLGKNN